MDHLIFLLRHGAIDNPPPRRFLGRTDLPLNADGIRQARDLGRWLGAIPFRRVCASPLARAVETAALVSGRPAAAIERVETLVEIDLGAWEGLSLAEVQVRFPGEYEQRGQDLAAYRTPGGESFSEVADRACPAGHARAAARGGPHGRQPGGALPPAGPAPGASFGHPPGVCGGERPLRRPAGAGGGGRQPARGVPAHPSFHATG
jgi:probable phosphoglycerate mutase